MNEQQLGDRLRRALGLERPPATSSAEIRERAARRQAATEVVGELPPDADERTHGYHLDHAATTAPKRLEAFSRGEREAAAGDLATATWRKSAMSTHNGCVEVAFMEDGVAVRSSAEPTGPVLLFTQREWVAFVSGVRDGEFDAEL